MNHEPSEAAIYSARLAKAYPSLSAYSAASLATELCAIERAQQRHAERCCNGEDGGYVMTGSRTVRDTDGNESTILVPRHDPDAEERAGKRVETMVTRWENRLVAFHDRGPVNLLAQERAYPRVELKNDPRGRVLLLRLPDETEAS